MHMRLFRILAIQLVCSLLSAQVHAAAEKAPPLLVYGAASLTNVLQELGTAYQSANEQEVKFSFAASSTLARQIEAGARADIFFSADEEWMDYLQSRKLINIGSRTNLLSNRLVLVAPADSTVQLKIAPGFALSAALGTGRLSMGDPDSVPAGKYARSALQSLSVWNDLENKIVRADSVRTALLFVSRGEAPLGIVDYFPASSHPAIVYPVALTATASADADKFVAFLRGPIGEAAFKKYGFSVLK
jgi:molybdate transport system substrate-binding protein